MGKVFCAIDKGNSIDGLGCQTCRDHISLKAGNVEFYCITGLIEWATRRHPYLKDKNMSLSLTNQPPAGFPEGKEEE